MPYPKKSSPENPIVIKKYANRRLYNTETSMYVTLEDLCQMIKKGEHFIVYDAKAAEDITHSVLTQIIFEQESKGKNLFPIEFLRKIICFYDDSVSTILPQYLEASLDAFINNQDQMRALMQSNMAGIFPSMQQFNEIGKQNLAMMRQAFSMFSPFDAFINATSQDESNNNPNRKEAKV